MSSQSCWVWSLSLWMAFAWPSLDYPKSGRSSGKIKVWNGRFQDRPFSIINCWVCSLRWGRPCSGPSSSRSASLFTTFLFTISCPLTPPFPISKAMDFLLNSFERTSNRIVNTQNCGQKLSQNCEQTELWTDGLSDCYQVLWKQELEFFSGPGLYYKVLLCLEFGFWFGKALFRIRSLVLKSPGWFCKGNIKMQDFSRSPLPGDAAFSKYFQVSFARSRKGQGYFVMGVAILAERPAAAQESGLCKVFLQVEFANAGDCWDFCKDEATRAWIPIGLAEGWSENITFSRDLLQRRSQNADLPRLLCKDDSNTGFLFFCRGHMTCKVYQEGKRTKNAIAKSSISVARGGRTFSGKSPLHCF